MTMRERERWLRPDHGRALVRGVQRAAELVSVPAAGEHFRRRPVALLAGAGLAVERAERFAGGVVERVVAVKPG